MPDSAQYYSNEMDQLADVMRTRLSKHGVPGSDEGKLIHLALGCVENYWMRPEGTNEDGGLVNPCRIMVQVQNIRPVVLGIWEVTARLVYSPDTVVTKQGSLDELVRTFQASKPIISLPVTLAPG